MVETFGVSLANSSHKGDRMDADFYETPPEVTLALLRFLSLPHGSSIWECACGAGKMSSVFESEGYRVLSTDLHYRGHGEGDVNFLDSDLLTEYVITNPPFNESEGFIEHAANLGLRGFAFLLKSQYWHSQRRQRLWNLHTPSYVLPLTWRPDFYFGKKGGSPTMEVCWTVWLSPTSSIPVPSGTQYIPLLKLK